MAAGCRWGGGGGGHRWAQVHPQVTLNHSKRGNYCDHSVLITQEKSNIGELRRSSHHFFIFVLQYFYYSFFTRFHLWWSFPKPVLQCGKYLKWIIKIYECAAQAYFKLLVFPWRHAIPLWASLRLGRKLLPVLSIRHFTRLSNLRQSQKTRQIFKHQLRF